MLLLSGVITGVDVFLGTTFLGVETLEVFFSAEWRRLKRLVIFAASPPNIIQRVPLNLGKNGVKTPTIMVKYVNQSLFHIDSTHFAQTEMVAGGRFDFASCNDPINELSCSLIGLAMSILHLSRLT